MNELEGGGRKGGGRLGKKNKESETRKKVEKGWIGRRKCSLLSLCPQPSRENRYQASFPLHPV